MHFQWRILTLTGLLLCGAVCPLVWAQAFGSTTHDKTKPVSLITFSVTQRALLPPTITVAPGRYMVRVKNGIVKGELNVVLSNSAASRSGRLKLESTKGRAVAYFDLDPGEYTVRVDEFPKLSAVVVVKP